MKEFQKGQRIKTVSGGELEVIQKLGEGGQGVVYKVNYNGKPLALKWYFGNKLNNADKFYRNIQNNIKQGTPTGAFLWPLEITEYFEGSFGYLMELRPPEYKDFSLFLLAKVHFANIEALINTALCITNGFRELHNRGYSYQDLNDGNFFVNPKTGDVLICDNDNVAPYGENLGIAGKCRYMAPEVVMGQKRPDSHTDRFSLAVVLYKVYCLPSMLNKGNAIERFAKKFGEAISIAAGDSEFDIPMLARADTRIIPPVLEQYLPTENTITISTSVFSDGICNYLSTIAKRGTHKHE